MYQSVLVMHTHMFDSVPGNPNGGSRSPVPLAVGPHVATSRPHLQLPG